MNIYNSIHDVEEWFRAVHKMAVVSVFVVFVLAVCRCHGQNYPFRNTSLSFEERVKVRTTVWLRGTLAKL